MNKAVDITLSTIHRGGVWTVVTLGIDGKDLASDFLMKLQRDNVKLFKSMKTRFRTVANYDAYENRETFKSTSEKGIFEFKRPGLRVYAFYDEIEGSGKLILCTNGGKKNTRKDQHCDIVRAGKIRKRYFNAKALPDTKIVIQEKL